MCPPSLDDLPTLAAIAHTSDDLIPIYDLTATGSSKVRKISSNALRAIPTDGVTAVTAGTITVTTPVLLINAGTTSTVTLPSVSGTLRYVNVANGGSGSATIATTVFSAASPAGAANSTISTGGYAAYASNGTNWYRVH